MAVRGSSFTIRDGEFFSLLGPSGCGKTTTLRMIAGFVEPDAGRIVLQGRDVTTVPPPPRQGGAAGRAPPADRGVAAGRLARGLREAAAAPALGRPAAAGRARSRAG